MTSFDISSFKFERDVVTEKAYDIMRRFTSNNDKFKKYTEYIGTPNFLKLSTGQHQLEFELCIYFAEELNKNGFTNLSLFESIIMHSYFFTTNYDKKEMSYDKNFMKLVDNSGDDIQKLSFYKDKDNVYNNMTKIYRLENKGWESEYKDPHMKFTTNKLSAYFFFVILYNLLELRIKENI